MNKATLLKILQEEHVDTLKKRIKEKPEEFKIYRNPTMKDWNDLVMEQHAQTDHIHTNPKMIRFIIDFSNNSLFVFSAGVIHNDAAEKLGLPSFFSSSRRYFSGSAKLDGGKLVMINSDNLDVFNNDNKLISDLISKDYKWTYKYFDTDLQNWLMKHTKSGKVKNLKDIK